MKKIPALLKQEFVPAIAFLCAFISMFFVKPSLEAYLGYMDFRVLALLFCLMAVVAGFQDCGVFTALSQALLSGQRSLRLVTLALVLLPFFSSMLITNDVALIAFVPFTVLVLVLVKRMEHMIYIIVLQTIAANLGSMATPVGNPQNLFLYEAFDIRIPSFFAVTLPLTLISLIGLSIAALCIKNEKLEVSFPEPWHLRRLPQLWSMVGLFGACMFSVLRVLDWCILLVFVVLYLAVFARHLFGRVDYGLLFTFCCFFVFAGNIGAIPAVKDTLSALMERSTFFTALFSSQLISNVPAAVLLSQFTTDWKGILLGTDIGGLGTPIASLASLISYRLYLRAPGAEAFRFILLFLLANLIGLVVLTIAAYGFLL